MAWTSIALPPPPPPPLPPRPSAKQQQAASESHAYALAAGLVLALETDEHLQYHHSVAADAARRISAGEATLSDGHLPPLVIPAALAAVTEAWAVPQRVAGVLEAACRWLADDELQQCEAQVVAEQVAATAKPVVRRSALKKLERPLLLSDPDDDCAELQRTVACFSSWDGRRWPGCSSGNGSEEEAALFTVPCAAAAYAARLDERLRDETMAVSEHVIQWLAALLGSMAWTEDDQAAFAKRQGPVSGPTRLSVSPPLPPVLLPEEFVPEGDACLVSDASDFSSGVSEALAEAEHVLTTNTGEAWVGEAAEMDANPLMAMLPAASPRAGQDSMRLPAASRSAQIQEESDLSEPQSSPFRPRRGSADSVDDEPIFSTWIDESAYAPAGTGDELDGYPEGNRPGTAREPEYGAITADTVFGLGETEAVARARIPIPAVASDTAGPGWHNVGGGPSEMLQWIMANNEEAFCPTDRAPSPPAEQEDRRTPKGEDCRRLDAETLEVGQRLMATMASIGAWLSETPDTQTALIDSVFAVRFARMPQGIDDCEQPLGMPQEKPPRPAQDTGAQSWGCLMSRFKKRKNDSSLDEGTMRGSETAPPTVVPQQASRITAPELMIGVRAFESFAVAAAEADLETAVPPDPPPQMDNDAPAPAVPDDSARHPNSAKGRPPPCQKVILSASIPRALRTHILEAVPGLAFVERDYLQPHHITSGGGIMSDEADIVVSPSTSIVIATMVSLRQTDSQRRPVFQARLACLASKYSRLHVLIYRAQAQPTADSDAGGSDDLPAFSPSDATAFAQLQGFARHGLGPCKVTVSYIGRGGEPAVARQTASLLQAGDQDSDGGGTTAPARFLADEATQGELFLRQAGLNAYDAQIVLGLLQASSGQARSKASPGADSGSIQAFMDMPADERLRQFGAAVGCRRAMERVNRLLEGSMTASRDR